MPLRLELDSGSPRQHLVFEKPGAGRSVSFWFADAVPVEVEKAWKLTGQLF
jgi:hypothetical protein